MSSENDELRARLAAIMPLFEEARDALCALRPMQVKLHNISPTLADRMDDVGDPERWKARRENAEPGVVTIPERKEGHS